ncbi:hypothetical protein CP_0689 [Chlamydia pneumoniae AR39]|uniref:Uncharacterized protein n=1 Tax=Chlamydia pneumoniae TaxID=83558 RepID=Q9K213_CHLPN|nr:hypothetical protein CP_0689 [Chlamydia pneumoniae AR39]
MLSSNSLRKNSYKHRIQKRRIAFLCLFESRPSSRSKDSLLGIFF